MVIQDNDLVRLKEPVGTDDPGVMKVATIHSVRTGHERTMTAECLLPPHDNPNRFVLWPVSALVPEGYVEPPKEKTPEELAQEQVADLRSRLARLHEEHQALAGSTDRAIRAKDDEIRDKAEAIDRLTDLNGRLTKDLADARSEVAKLEAMLTEPAPETK